MNDNEYEYSNQELGEDIGEFILAMEDLIIALMMLFMMMFLQTGRAPEDKSLDDLLKSMEDLRKSLASNHAPVKVLRMLMLSCHEMTDVLKKSHAYQQKPDKLLSKLAAYRGGLAGPRHKKKNLGM